jgi:hypothetical protein
VTVFWIKLHKEEFHNFCSSPGIIKTIKSRRMVCMGHVARKEDTRNWCKILVGKPEGKKAS